MLTKITNLVNKMGKLLRDKHISLVTCESCTGGGLAFFISINPQASSLLERGYVTYSNQSKEEILNVKPLFLQTEGAVSKKVVIQMAKGALKRSNAQLSIAVTGIAGEDISKQKKDKGIVWICCCSSVNKNIIVKYLMIRGNREQFCQQTISECLKLIISYCQKLV